MKPAPFEYYAPRTLDEALTLLAAHGSDAKPLAGGQSLVPAMNFRLATPAVLVDLNGIAALAGIEEHDGQVRVGAMTRQRSLETSDVIARRVPLVALALPHVAHAAIRTRGTLGGSAAHADPAAELPAVLVALDAAFTLQSATATRTVDAATFFTGLFATAIEPGELLTTITIPAEPPESRRAFLEIARRHGDFALAGVAASATVDDDGRCRQVRVALLGVGDRPVLAGAARVLEGERPTAALVREAAAAVAAQDVDPHGDIHASSDYRRHLVEVVVRRALAEMLNTGGAVASS